MIQVPKEFQTKMPFAYPASNHLIFEEWFFENWKPEDSRERKYLPIFVNGYQVGNNYGQNKPKMEALQNYIDSLDKSQKYYLITQYDDGILCNLDGLDIRVYAMSGSRVDYALPLLCQPMPFKHEHTEKRYLANFIGRITHPVRNKVVDALKNRNDCFVHVPKTAWDQMNEFYYSQILAESIFTICPRGYGWNSFRIAEALQYGSIPVIISDDYKSPHYIDYYGWAVYIREDSLQFLDGILKDLSKSEISEMRIYGEEVYKSHFTYESNKKLILEDLKNN